MRAEQERGKQGCNWKSERHACFRALQLYLVKAKFFLLLECVLICVVMAPIMNIAYNGMRYNSALVQILWGFFWCVSVLVGQSLWALTYPKRLSWAWSAIGSVVAVLFTIVPGMMRVCNGTLITYYITQLGPAKRVHKLGDLFMQSALALSFILWMVLYRGKGDELQIKYKVVFGAAISFTPLIILMELSSTLELDEMVYTIVLGVQFLVFILVGLFGGHSICKEPKQITGRHYAFVGIVAVVFVLMGIAIMTLYVQIYAALSSPWERTAVWLVTKVLYVFLINLWAKLACYAMSNDVQFQLVIMIMLMTLQFSTELMFISIAPFDREFFFVLSLKASMHILVKGGVLKKLYVKLHTCLVHHQDEKLINTCICKILLGLLKALSDRGPPYLHLVVPKGDIRLVQTFLTDLLYADVILLASVLCSICCAVVVGMEIFLESWFPKDFERGVWTAKYSTDTRWSIFYGYLFVVAWNVATMQLVLWLTLRDSADVKDVLDEVEEHQHEDIHARSKIWAFHIRKNKLATLTEDVIREKRKRANKTTSERNTQRLLPSKEDNLTAPSPNQILPEELLPKVRWGEISSSDADIDQSPSDAGGPKSRAKTSGAEIAMPQIIPPVDQSASVDPRTQIVYQEIAMPVVGAAVVGNRDDPLFVSLGEAL